MYLRSNDNGWHVGNRSPFDAINENLNICCFLHRNVEKNVEKTIQILLKLLTSKIS